MRNSQMIGIYKEIAVNIEIIAHVQISGTL